MFPGTQKFCWHCGGGNTTFEYIWWKYLIIKRFWKQVHGDVHNMLGFPITFCLQNFLLHYFQGTIDKACHKSLLATLFTAAAILLAKNWKSPQTPSLHEWRIKACYVFLKCKLTAINKFRSGSLKAIAILKNQWAPFVEVLGHYRMDQITAQSILDIL